MGGFRIGCETTISSSGTHAISDIAAINSSKPTIT